MDNCADSAHDESTAGIDPRPRADVVLRPEMTLRLVFACAFVLAVMAGVAAPLPAYANPIERACNTSNRPTATRALCSCIGSAADNGPMSLSQMRAGRAGSSP